MNLLPLRNNHGIALLMTLAFVTLAVSIALETNRRARFSIEACAVHQYRAAAAQMAAGGIHAAIALLIEDRYGTATDHLKEPWSDKDQLAARMAAIGFDEGRVTVTIEDELARIQVNALVDFPQGRQFVTSQQQLMARMVQELCETLSIQTDGTSATDIVNAIKDWLDSGDDDAITGLNGAENDYYQGQQPAYRCGNGPIRHINELGRIKGVSMKLLEGEPGHPGLASYLTVYGARTDAENTYTFPGTINLNTVSTPVLHALLPMESQDLAELIIDYRDTLAPQSLASTEWYRQAPGPADALIDPNQITFTSDLFRIQATADLHNVKRQVTAVVERGKIKDTGNWGCRILDWEMQ